jgi:hypothetical protein
MEVTLRRQPRLAERAAAEPDLAVAIGILPVDERDRELGAVEHAGAHLVLNDAGSELAPSSKPQPDGTLIKALARAWRWQKLLDTGVYISAIEIAEAEGINKSYVSRFLRPGAAGARHRGGVEAFLEGQSHARLRAWSGSCRPAGKSSAGAYSARSIPEARGAVVREVLCGCCESSVRKHD